MLIPGIADPDERLSANELIETLGLANGAGLRAIERGGTAICLASTTSDAAREFPILQTWPGIAGQPLAQVVGALGEYVPARSPAAYMFFISPDDLLGYLTPIEALIGQVIFTTDREPTTAELLTLSHELRVEVVVGAARAYAACSNA